jgi:GntR family transcriptional repressor for pyruvate dehydrogenase complex
MIGPKCRTKGSLIVSSALEPQPSVPAGGDLEEIRPPQRRSLPRQVADELLARIAGGQAAEVALPPERQLSEQLGVSRNVIREALSALNHLGVIETRGKLRIGLAARSRAQLLARAPVDGAERELLIDPIEARRVLEPEVAAIAAERASEEILQEAQHWLELMEQARLRDDRAADYDSAFHVSIARATGNRTLIELIATLTDTLQDSRELSFRPPEAMDTAIEDHRLILEAVRAGDVAGARLAMGRHLGRVESLIRRSLSRRLDGT